MPAMRPVAEFRVASPPEGKKVRKYGTVEVKYRGTRTLTNQEIIFFFPFFSSIEAMTQERFELSV